LQIGPLGSEPNSGGKPFDPRTAKAPLSPRIADADTDLGGVRRERIERLHADVAKLLSDQLRTGVDVDLSRDFHGEAAADADRGAEGVAAFDELELSGHALDGESCRDIREDIDEAGGWNPSWFDEETGDPEAVIPSRVRRVLTTETEGQGTESFGRVEPIEALLQLDTRAANARTSGTYRREERGELRGVRLRILRVQRAGHQAE